MKNHVCDSCNIKFQFKCELIKHISTKHEKGEAQICNLCEKTFSHGNYLKKHISMFHHESKNAISKCHFQIALWAKEPISIKIEKESRKKKRLHPCQDLNLGLQIKRAALCHMSYLGNLILVTDFIGIYEHLLVRTCTDDFSMSVIDCYQRKWTIYRECQQGKVKEERKKMGRNVLSPYSVHIFTSGFSQIVVF